MGDWTEKGMCVTGEREGGKIEHSVDLKMPKQINCMYLRDVHVMCYISSLSSQTLPIKTLHC